MVRSSDPVIFPFPRKITTADSVSLDICILDTPVKFVPSPENDPEKLPVNGSVEELNCKEEEMAPPPSKAALAKSLFLTSVPFNTNAFSEVVLVGTLAILNWSNCTPEAVIAPLALIPPCIFTDPVMEVVVVVALPNCVSPVTSKEEALSCADPDIITLSANVLTPSTV